MWNIITLDGYFDGETNWDLSFHDLVWGPEMEKFCLQQLHTTSHLLFGRITFEGMASYWKKEKGQIADLMNNLEKIVCSKTLETVDWNNSRILKTSIKQEIEGLKARNKKDIYVFGSANLSETLTRENLFDEYRICIAPVVARKGRPLFVSGLPVNQFSLISSQSLETGGVILIYQPK